MNLSNIVSFLPIQAKPGQKWAIFGPDIMAYAPLLNFDPVALVPFNDSIVPELDGLLLAEALSASAKMPLAAWLRAITGKMQNHATLLVVDWQDDGPPDYGPDYNLRFKKGRLCRLLREWGFGTIDILENHPVYYLVKAVKSPPPELPQAQTFVDVASLAELPKNAMKVVELFGQKLVVANTGREIVAFARTCPHAGGLFDQGILRSRNVACPKHGYIWNVCSGYPIEPPDEDILPRYTVKVNHEQGRVLVALISPRLEA